MCSWDFRVTSPKSSHLHRRPDLKSPERTTPARRLYKTVEERDASLPCSLFHPACSYVLAYHVGDCRPKFILSQIPRNRRPRIGRPGKFDKTVARPADLYKTVMRHCACNEQNHKPCLPRARSTLKGDFYSGGPHRGSLYLPGFIDLTGSPNRESVSGSLGRFRDATNNDPLKSIV